MMMGLWLVAGIILAFGFVVFFGAPYVPSRPRHIELAFDELYTLSTNDTVLDLGAGDGVVLRAATRRGARAVGYELNPLLVLAGYFLNRKYPKARLRLANLWRRPFPDDTTVVYLFGDGRDIARLTRLIESEAARLGRTLSVISYGFTLPGHTPAAETSVHFLYKVKALQSEKPQV